MSHASFSALPAVTVVGDVRADVERAGLRLGAGGPAVIAGPVGERASAAHVAIADGCDVFLAWPPGSIADAEALVALADEGGVEVGVERPLGLPILPAAARLLSVRVPASPSTWPRRIAGALDMCAWAAGTHGAARIDAEAERVGAELQAVALSVRFRNGVLAQVLVYTSGGDEATLYASGTETEWAIVESLGTDAVAFVQAVVAGERAPYPLHQALATMRLAERVMESLR